MDHVSGVRMHSDQITTQEAADVIGIKLSRVQQLCRAYLATKEGIACEKIGEGRHAIYLVSRRAAEEYRDSIRNAGWPKGKKRGAKQKADENGSVH
jgi:hypothetical protein